MYKGLSVDHMKSFLKEFSGFRTRYYRSETGRQSQHFLLKTISEVSRRLDGSGRLGAVEKG